MEYLGSFADVLHITARDVDLLTVEEFELYVTYLARREEAQRQADNQSGGH